MVVNLFQLCTETVNKPNHILRLSALRSSAVGAMLSSKAAERDMLPKLTKRSTLPKKRPSMLLVIKYQRGKANPKHRHVGKDAHQQKSHTSQLRGSHVSVPLVSRHSLQMCFKSFLFAGAHGTELGTPFWWHFSTNCVTPLLLSS